MPADIVVAHSATERTRGFVPFARCASAEQKTRAIQAMVGDHLTDPEADQVANLLDRLRGCSPNAE